MLAATQQKGNLHICRNMPGLQCVHLVAEHSWAEADGELSHMDALRPRCRKVPGLVDGYDGRENAQRGCNGLRPRKVQA